MSSDTPVTRQILSLARSGATQRAWEAFVAAGLEHSDEVSALTLKGRLLKDRARSAIGADQAQLYAKAGDAYRQAARIKIDSYPLVNAAALALFAGDGASAEAIARDVLTLIDADPAQGETPYWREATRAEALLLLARGNEGKDSLTAAMRLAPQAWEDHAATLRQFALILQHRGQDTAWLDALRPAPSLHFSGILGIAAHDTNAVAAINDAIEAINPGFGYGALAAGADIIAAEALIARGAELHVVLPCALDIFRIRSVAMVDADWLPRFDALIASATTLTCCSIEAELSEAAIILANQVAMGMAIDQSVRLESHAVALRVFPAQRSVNDDVWHATGRALQVVTVEPQVQFSSGPALTSGVVNFTCARESQNAIQIESFASIGAALAFAERGDRVAFDCSNDQGELASAMLQGAPHAPLVASHNAAMIALANGLCRAVEPLGEMLAPHGPVAVYALLN